MWLKNSYCIIIRKSLENSEDCLRNIKNFCHDNAAGISSAGRDALQYFLVNPCKLLYNPLLQQNLSTCQYFNHNAVYCMITSLKLTQMQTTLQWRIHIITGTAAATFPISSSVCIIFFILAWWKTYQIKMSIKGLRLWIQFYEN